VFETHRNTRFVGEERQDVLIVGYFRSQNLEYDELRLLAGLTPLDREVDARHPSRTDLQECFVAANALWKRWITRSSWFGYHATKTR
jgi:hypothetical protein